MVDRNAAQLCQHIVFTHFGPFVAKVASVLLARGRLSLLQIVRFTGLKPRTVRAALLVLIQHNLVWHAQNDLEGEVLEFRADECILRLRYGQYVHLANKIFGAPGGEIVSLILDNGKMLPPEIIGRLSKSKGKEMALYTQNFHKLVAGSYLKPSTALSHMSPRDKLLQYEAEAKKEIKNFPTAKELLEAKEKAKARFKREEEEEEKIAFVKRKVNDFNGARSGKRKITEEEVPDDTVYFRVNPARFDIHIRNQLIETAARERLNDAAGLVMRACLKACENKQLRMSDPRSEPTPLTYIAEHIPDSDVLSSGLVHSTKSPSLMLLLKEYLNMLAAADNPTPAGRAGSFISMIGSSSTKVQVEFEIICRRLRRRVLEAVARERYGDEAVRIIRLLLEEGKMNAEQLAKVAMMSNKDVRPLLTSLSEDSLVCVYEVPKGADRHPQRTFYLWHVDLSKAYAVLLGNFYKILYNINARLQAEEWESSVKAVLDKMQRSDVRDDPSLLTRTEREILKDWEARREKLMILEQRVGEVVFILKEFAVFSTNDE